MAAAQRHRRLKAREGRRRVGEAAQVHAGGEPASAESADMERRRREKLKGRQEHGERKAAHRKEAAVKEPCRFVRHQAASLSRPLTNIKKDDIALGGADALRTNAATTLISVGLVRSWC
jgi:hypothetical protein